MTALIIELAQTASRGFLALCLTNLLAESDWPISRRLLQPARYRDPRMIGSTPMSAPAPKGPAGICIAPAR
jgi:hypothetical protein